MPSSLITTAILKGFLNGLRNNDCDVNLDEEAGTVDVKDGDTVVLRAIQKGHNQPWIASFYSSDRISWGPAKTE